MCHACSPSGEASDAERRATGAEEPTGALPDGWYDSESYVRETRATGAEEWSEGGAGGDTAPAAGASGAAENEPSPAPRTGPLRIFPLGDSITGSSCYRAVLYDALVEAGRDFDFTGSLDSRGDCDHPGYDGDHEGHGGYLVTDLATPGASSELAAWCRQSPSDVVLLHFGSNDLWSARPVEDILSAYDAVLAELRANNARVVVLAAQIIPLAPEGCAECPARSSDLNAAIPGWAESRSLPESPVIVVDQHGGFDSAEDTRDGVHPNASGSRKMAERWFDALAPLF